MNDRYPWKAAQFQINRTGRDFVAGDLHGQFNLLEQSLVKLNFDFENDRLFCVGDLIDRGSQSSRISEFLNFNWFNSIAGNHEWMLVNSHDDEKLKHRLWFPNGGQWWKHVSSQVQLDIVDSVQMELFSTITLETKSRKVGLVHALTYPFYSWREFCGKLETDTIIQQWALWERDFDAFNQKRVTDIDLVVCGHTPMDKPFSFSNFVNIDTGCGHPISPWLAEPALTIIELSEALIFHRFV